MKNISKILLFFIQKYKFIFRIIIKYLNNLKDIKNNVN